MLEMGYLDSGMYSNPHREILDCFRAVRTFDIGSLRFSYLCVDVFQALKSGQLGNSIFQLQRDTKTSVRSRPLCSVLATRHVAYEAAKSE